MSLRLFLAAFSILGLATSCLGQGNATSSKLVTSKQLKDWEVEPNVVLGRELVLLTKVIDDAKRAESEATQLRTEIAIISSNVVVPSGLYGSQYSQNQADTLTSLESDANRIASYGQGIDDRIRQVKEWLSEASEENADAEVPTKIIGDLSAIQTQIDHDRAAIAQHSERLDRIQLVLMVRDETLNASQQRLDLLKSSSIETMPSSQPMGFGGGGFGENLMRPPGASTQSTATRTDALETVAQLESESQTLAVEAAELVNNHARVISFWKATTERAVTMLQELDGVQAEIAESLARLQTQKEQVENALSKRDADLVQFEINKMLVWAVYGMIVTIIALFVLLKYFPTSLTDLIVEQRVVVEVLSMGFLLVTVIILGSAKLIQGEGLAGLLGTIAGYIFAKKTSDLMSGDKPGSTESLERRLMQSQLELAELNDKLDAYKAQVGSKPTLGQQQMLEKLERQVRLAASRRDTFREALAREGRPTPPAAMPESETKPKPDKK